MKFLVFITLGVGCFFFACEAAPAKPPIKPVHIRPIDQDLINAASHNRTREVLDLLQQGANPRVQGSPALAASQSETPKAQSQKDKDLVYTTRMEGDSAAGQQKILRLLQKGASPAFNKSAAFSWAIYHGNLTILNAFATRRAPLPPRPFSSVHFEDPKAPQTYRWLLAHGTKPDFYALQSALRSEVAPDKLLQVLLEAGANPNSRGWWTYLNDEKVWATPLMVASQCAGTPGYSGPQFPDGRMIKALLARGAKINERTKDGRTALDFALLEGFEAPVNARVLLQAGADVGKQSLPLLDIGANRNEPLIIDELDERNLLPKKLSFAALRFPTGSGVVKRLLAHGADPNEADQLGYTELHRVAASGEVESVKMLLDAGANIEAKTTEGFTPLFRADTFSSQEERGNLAQKLLLERGANPNVRAENEVTPLIYATQGRGRGFGSETAAKLLCLHGADLTAKDSAGNTALHYAVRWSLPMVQTLLHANSSPEFLEARDVEGNTALLLAVSQGPDRSVDEEQQKMALPILQALLKAGAKTDAVDNEGNTIFHLGGREQLLFLLSSNSKLNIDVPNKQGFTPLYIACSNGAASQAIFFIQHGANPDIKAKNGLSPRQLVSKPFTARDLILRSSLKRQLMQAYGLDITHLAQLTKSKADEGRGIIAAGLKTKKPLKVLPAK